MTDTTLKTVPNGKLQAIAKLTGVSAKLISEYRSTIRRPGTKRAAMLQEKLGIPAVTWLYGTEEELTEAILDLRIVIEIGRRATVELKPCSEEAAAC